MSGEPGNPKSFAIAHLTDIHIVDPSDPILSRADQIAMAISSSLNDAERLFLVVTGDIAFSGLRSQYQLAIVFLRAIADRVHKETSVTIDFIVCPGNHDCDFGQDQEIRNLVLDAIAADKIPSEKAIETCTSIQSEYFSFESELTGKPPLEGRARLFTTRSYDLQGGVVAFDVVNLSWVSRLPEEKVSFPLDILPEKKKSVGLVVSLMHHPFNWISNSGIRDFRKRIRSSADVIFTGHEHQWNAIEALDVESGATLQIEGSVLQNRKEPDRSGFSVVLIDQAASKYKLQFFDWDGVHYRSARLEDWSKYRDLEIAAVSGAWVLSPSFEAELEDLGITLRLGSEDEVTLSDVFILPGLHVSHGTRGSTATELDSVEALVEFDGAKMGFLLQGDEKSGKSSLLKRIFRSYLAGGRVPLLLSPETIYGASEADVERSLASALKRQYVGCDLDMFSQLPKERRVVLVDDLDEVAVKTLKARGQLLDRIRKQCGVLVISAGEAFEASQLAGTDSGPLDSFPRCRLQPFGHLARTRLIKKWAYVFGDDIRTEEERVARVDHAEKFVAAVLNRGVVPAYPIYLLTLLHSLQNSGAQSLQEGGFGHYYEYLITEAILAAGIPKNQLGKLFDYCTELAWHFQKRGKRAFSDKEFREFNSTYSEKYFTVEFGPRRDLLIEAKLVSAANGSFSFKYDYHHFYFVARYLSDHLDETEVCDYIRESSRLLYVRSRANALVFLTHFSNNKFVVDAILAALRDQFRGEDTIRFDRRDESVEALLRELPKLAFDPKDPLESREEAAKVKDERGDTDGLVEAPENGSDLSIGARLVTVFKTVEILGQILRTQFSKFDKPRKDELISEIISGPLRALEGFYSVLRKHPKGVIAYIKAAVDANEREMGEPDKERLASKLAAVVVLLTTFGFMRKSAEALSSEDLREDLERVIGNSDDLAFQLVGLSTILDAQRPLPRQEIEEILHSGESSLVVERLVHLMVIFRMYMFRTSASDVQWARDVLKIPTKQQFQALLSSQ